MNSKIAAPSTIEEFRSRIDAIERLDKSGAAIAKLSEAIRDLNRGMRVGMPQLHSGLKIYRAAKMNEKTCDRARISYPPKERCDKNGRVNAPGEVVFYGSISCRPSGQELQPFELGCLYECAAHPGERYVVGEWIVFEPMRVGHIGYSATGLSGNNFRVGQPWMALDDENPVTPYIRQWQSDVFTRKVAKGDEDRYRMSIAIGKFCVRPCLEDDDVVSGLVFPSVASELCIDNVAIVPSEVDRALRLRRAWFVEVQSVFEVRPELGTGEPDMPIGRMDIKFLDSSRECRDDGMIVWWNGAYGFFPPTSTRTSF
jgi:hypothetical protein